MPIAGTNFTYSFHADLEFENIAQFDKVLAVIKTITKEVTVYGIYKNGQVFTEE
jgi:prephenate dehydratase